MGLLGGISLIVIGGMNNYISWDIPLFIQMLYGGCIVTCLEFITGLIDRYFLHIHMWDYSNLPMNLMGIICVPFFLAWMALSFVAIIISDVIEYYMFHEETRPYYKNIYGKILFMLPKRECE